MKGCTDKCLEVGGAHNHRDIEVKRRRGVKVYRCTGVEVYRRRGLQA